MKRREFITLLGGAAALAARGARAAAGDAGDRVSPRRFARAERASRGGVPPGPERNRLCRGPERRDRIPLGGRSLRSTAGAGGRSGPPAGRRDRRTGQRRRGDSRPRPRPRQFRSSSASAATRSSWPCRQPQPAGRQRHRRELMQRRAGGRSGWTSARACCRAAR